MGRESASSSDWSPAQEAEYHRQGYDYERPALKPGR